MTLTLSRHIEEFFTKRSQAYLFIVARIVSDTTYNCNSANNTSSLGSK